MEKKQILFINGHLNAGGVERSLVDILCHFDYESYEVDLLLLEGYGDYLPEIPSQVNVVMYPLADASGPLLQTLYEHLKKRRFLLFVYRLLTLISMFLGNRVLKLLRPFFINGNKSYDVVIGFRPNNATIFAAYLFYAKKRIAWWHHGEMNINGKQQESLLYAYDRMDIIVAVSESCACMLKDVFPSIQNKIQIIPNMVCMEEILSKVKNTNITMDSSVCNIVSVGRMSLEKNMMFCVDVAKRLKEYAFSFYWYLIGDGVELLYIQNKIKEQGLSDYITLTGRLTNPYPYIQKADLFFHPSLVESQGLTILEAMVLHTPVISVKSLGPKEFIVNGVNGILISPNIHAAAENIMQVYKDSNLRQVMSAEGFETVRQYSPSNIKRLVENLLLC